MGNILHMETDAARAVAQKLSTLAETLVSHSDALSGALNGLSWQSPSRDEYVANFEQYMRTMRSLSAAAITLSLRMQHEVDEWELAASTFGAPGSSGTAGTAGIAGGFAGGFAGGGGGGGGGGAFGAPDDELYDHGHTEYTLLYGRQVQIYAGYRQGDMTFDEMLAYMAEDPFAPDYVETKVVFYKDEQAASEAVWEANYLGDNLNVSLLSLEGSIEKEIALTKDGLEATVGFEAGAYVGKAEYNATVAGIGVAGLAYVGANAQGDAGVYINPAEGTFGVKAGVEAFAGGKIEGSVTKEFEVAGVDAEVGAHGAISYGIGFEANADVGFDKGVLKAEVDLGATLGLGAEFGFTVEVDVQDAVGGVVDAGKDFVDWLF